MLSSASVTTMLPVKDIARARPLRGLLGLRPGGFRADGKFVYVVGGSTLALFPKPEGTKGEQTTRRSASGSTTSPPASAS